jgi:FAD-dependent urate hydroxylase
LHIDMQNDAELRSINVVAPDLFKLDFDVRGREQAVYARTIVLSPGAEGSGARFVPPLLSNNVPAHLYAHTNDAIDLTMLKGKKIAVLGAGASAFDYASASLEAGAKEAHIFFRRKQLPLQNPRRWMEFSGFLAHYPELPDAMRWAYMKRLYEISQPPPVPTFERATSSPGFFMHPGSGWTQALAGDNKVNIKTQQGQAFEFDFVIAATGMVVDLTLRPELSAIAPSIALWRDRYSAPGDMADSRLDRFPYLGRYCDFQEKVPNTAPWLSRIFTITRGATMSMGPSAASNSNLKYTAPRIVAGVCRQLFLAQANQFYETFLHQEHKELQSDRVGALA